MKEESLKNYLDFISAIKLIRSITGVSLKEAKEFIESLPRLRPVHCIGASFVHRQDLMEGLVERGPHFTTTSRLSESEVALEWVRRNPKQAIMEASKHLV
jgi:hypothetical protein